jgi:hypothetical protein
MCVPNLIQRLKSSDVPMWYSEGVSDAVGNSIDLRGKLYTAIPDGPIAKLRLPVAHACAVEGRLMPLQKLLMMSRDEFNKPDVIFFAYAESWAFSQFLLTYPKYQDKEKQVPAGKYGGAIKKMHKAFAEGKGRDEAYKEAFGAAAVESGFKELDEQFAAWLKKFPDPISDVLGVREDVWSRVARGSPVGGVLAGSAAEKAGLQKGDAIHSFNGRPVTNWTDLFKALIGLKKGDKVPCSFDRGGKSQTVTVTIQ